MPTVYLPYVSLCAVPGACFLCNDCPSDEEDSDTPDPASCPSRPRGEGSSSCVETTAYALRALLAVGDREKTVCLAQWLIQIKSGSGGFYSSQVSTYCTSTHLHSDSFVNMVRGGGGGVNIGKSTFSWFCMSISRALASSDTWITIFSTMSWHK